ncbi:MAG: hypothetical protein SFV54_20780 [Bryobacteraceae bacterium]|nr:hypothetical protein [Bryobacteraceae bacterium]
MLRRTLLGMPFALLAQEGPWSVEEVRRYPAPEATQAVAVDAAHFYAIGSYAIAKYEKESGKRVAEWQCERGKPLIHLNSGVVRDGILYCAHSNYPGVPMVSSIEKWHTTALEHAGSHSLGIFAGSLTWLDVFDGRWFATFAHYRNRGAEPGKDPRWTLLVEFDDQWQQRRSWVYSEEIVAKMGDYSLSGGVFGPGGVIVCTGHDAAEVYVVAFPEGGSELVLMQTFPAPIEGQGIALDASGMLWGIRRRAREVVAMRLRGV